VITRSQLLRGALAATAAGGAAAVTPFLASAQQSQGDVPLLQLGLLLERIEGELYRRAPREIPDLSRTVRSLSRDFGRHEGEHEQAIVDLIGRLGGEAAPPPQLRLEEALRSEDAFLRAQQLLEETGVGAYNAAGVLVNNTDVLAVAGSIVQVEGRHAATINDLLGGDPAPRSFDAPVPGPEAMRRAMPFIG
jgi:hypothetical protein